MDNDEVCYVVMSRISGEQFRFNGIFTHKYMSKDGNGKKLWIKKQELRKKNDFVKTYIIPLNHFIEKGSVI